MLQAPELLSPAGTRKAMRFAYAYGADAVYAGQPRYSLRVRENEFSTDNIAESIAEAHALGKKFFLASNISPHNEKVKTYIKDLTPIMEAKPDAIIMADPGLIMMVREQWPDQEIHLSVQSNVVNFATVKFWKSFGVSRIILSRELSLRELEAMRNECQDMELEVFVHGALCMAYSGRCLLSGYINHRDANQGTCTNACRWKYDVKEVKEDEWGNTTDVQPTLGVGQPTDKTFVIQEQGKTDRGMILQEDEHGTHILNSKDLRAIHHVEKFVEMGINCLKIEGRTKSFFYVARTAQLYRQAIDDAVAGKPFNMQLMDDLEGLANRGYTEGLYRRHVHDEYQNYEQGNSMATKQKFVGEVTDYDASTGMAEINVKNKFLVGDSLQLMQPGGNKYFTLEHIEDKHGRAKESAPGSGHIVKIPVGELKNPELGLLIRDLPQ
ncbi:MAG: U32 family peptidase [Coxiella sp. (in: Bacteria)]|nr:MAG: U32 family peptidase [Coxiella sp. (in: g-proteobacteria)]